MFEWLQALYDNAMANADRRAQAYDSPDGVMILVGLLAVLAVVLGLRYLSRRPPPGKDDDDARW